MTKESQLLGTLIPTHPDLFPIVQKIRAKYGLGEISLDDPPIEEIYLGDKIIPLEDFFKEIEGLVQELSNFPEPKISDFYHRAKKLLAQPVKMRKYNYLSKVLKQSILDIYNLSKNLAVTLVKVMDEQFAIIAGMLYSYILTGEYDEVPNDWISRVMTLEHEDDKVVIAIANQVANPDVIVQQFREELKKAFGPHHPKVTKTIVSTAYYMRLERAGKPWNYRVGEFIRINNFQLPRDINSQRYVDTWNKYSRLLRKRIQRSEKVLEVLVDKK